MAAMSPQASVVSGSSVGSSRRPILESGDCDKEKESKSDESLKNQQNPSARGDRGDFSTEGELTSVEHRPSSATRTPLNSSTITSIEDSTASTDLDESLSYFYANDSNWSQENKTNLIINYLPPSMTQEEVHLLFSGIGEVERCKLVREKTTGESLCYAFVKFSHPEDAQRAIADINGLKIENKTVKVSVARPSCEAIRGANLYICGLPRSMTNAELDELFKSCGNIITSRILCEQNSDCSRGVAFIRFDKRSEAEVAISRFNGFVLPGTNEGITVKFANSPGLSSEGRRSASSRSAAGSSGQRRTKFTQSSGHNQSSVCNEHKSANNCGQNFPEVKPLPFTPPFSFGQLPAPQFRAPPFAAVQQIRSDMTVPSIYGYPGIHQGPFWPNVPPPIYGLANYGVFQRPTALSKFRNVPRGLRAAWGPMTNSQPSRTSIRPPSFMNRTRGHTEQERTDVSREFSATTQALLAPAYAANSGALTSNGWCIFVYNLAAETNDSVLWQLFGPFGAVHAANIIQDPATGRCKGYGFVKMGNYDEAVAAIRALNGFNLHNRILQVSFKTNKPLHPSEASAAPDKRKPVKFQQT
ncbi:ELAV-like protein 4 [Sparganum proliferum]